MLLQLTHPPACGACPKYAWTSASDTCTASHFLPSSSALQQDHADEGCQNFHKSQKSGWRRKEMQKLNHKRQAQNCFTSLPPLFSSSNLAEYFNFTWLGKCIRKSSFLVTSSHVFLLPSCVSNLLSLLPIWVTPHINIWLICTQKHFR